MRTRRSERGRALPAAGAAGVSAGVMLVIFTVSLATVLVLNFRWLYYLDITLLKLEEASGLSAARIRENYDALISYNLVWNRNVLVFPTLAMSREGAIHFAQVKQIFDVVQIAALCSGLLLLLHVFLLRGYSRRWMRTGGIVLLALPAVLGVGAALSWDRFFVLFHHLFFKNEYWLFDPAKDPVILILPDTFFLQCLALILGLVAAAGLVCLGIAGRKKG